MKMNQIRKTCIPGTRKYIALLSSLSVFFKKKLQISFPHNMKNGHWVKTILEDFLRFWTILDINNSK